MVSSCCKFNLNFSIQSLIFLNAETRTVNAVLILSQFFISLKCARIVAIFFFFHCVLIFALYLSVFGFFLSFFGAGNNVFFAVFIFAQLAINQKSLLVISCFF